MSYQKKNWEDLPDITTPVTATDLDRMENGIADANGAINVDAYDSTATYAVGDLCMYNNTLYTCITTISTAEVWNSNHWQATSIFDYLERQLLLKAHPVGSYYWSSESTSPATLFGGTWTQVKDKFVLAAGDTYSAGNTGGSASTTHQHEEGGIFSQSSNGAGGNLVSNWNGSNYGMGSAVTVSSAAYGEIQTSGNAGSKTAYPYKTSQVELNNMPPYEVAYCWKRTG